MDMHSPDCTHEDGAHPGLDGHALRHALSDAEHRCMDIHERLTAPRRRVLELLLESDGPMKAYDLIAAYGEGGEPAKPPTVYRALEFLERLGFAHRIESLNAYVPCRLNTSGRRGIRAGRRPRPSRRRRQGLRRHLRDPGSPRPLPGLPGRLRRPSA